MQSAFVIGVTDWLISDLRDCCAASDIGIYKILSRYPTGAEIFQLLGVFSPEIVFLQITHSQKELELLREIEACYPRIVIIGFGEPSEIPFPNGIRQFLAAPFSHKVFSQAIQSATAAQKATVRDNVVAFVPAKAGSGSTTLALQAARYLAQDCQQRVLLIEADVHSGPISLMLDLTPHQSIIDALENCHRLDDKNWPQSVTNTQGFDLLPAPTSAHRVHLQQWSYRRLLSFARLRYDILIADLPEVVNDATEAIVAESRNIYVVCTPDKASVLLARRRIYGLEAHGAKANQVAVVLNRHAKADAPVERIAESIGQPISFVVPNDYCAVQKASQNIRPVGRLSPLAQAISAFARAVGGLPLETEKTKLPWFRRMSA